MQIEKINKNQLEVILHSKDLRANNISLHSFMCNSIDTQHLFFSILTFANETIGFSFKNYEIIIEIFSIPIKNTFILLITRMPKKTYLHISKTKYGKFRASKSLWLKFDNLENLCMFCNSLKNSIITSSLYWLNNCYFLHIKTNTFKTYFSILNESLEFSNCIYKGDFILDENANIIIKDFAIQICKTFFI